MTAEIVLMNKSAVALAADSAVTFGGQGNMKIYNSINKLFELSASQPVGIMIYGSAEIAGIPWETIIKNFRNDLGRTSLPTVVSYQEEFLKYLTSHCDCFHEGIYKSEAFNFFYRHLYLFFVRFREKFKKILEQKGRLSEKEMKKIFKVELMTYFDIFSKSPDSMGINSKDAKNIFSKYNMEYKKAKDNIFEKLPLTPEEEKIIESIAIFALYKVIKNYDYSGVIFSGFGKTENFPFLTEVKIETILNGKIKYSQGQKDGITPFNNSAAIIPFAQSEMVHTFMEGIDPKHLSMQKATLEFLSQKSVEIAKKHSKIKGKKKIELFEKNFRKDCQEEIKKITDAMALARRNQNVNPILNAVISLPKDEMAAMAEALVNLTSFKRRVSMDLETVGGPIDVAVVSKGDGFIWIKRKHYFKLDMNPRYARRISK